MALREFTHPPTRQPGFILLWIFKPSGTKSIFDYIRNTGLCALVLFSAVLLERSVLDSPLFEISNSKSYEQLCKYALSNYDDLLEDASSEEAELIAEGFDRRASNLSAFLKEHDHQEAREVVGTIVYRKDQRISQGYANHVISLLIYVASLILLLANYLSLVQLALKSTQPVFSGSIGMNALRLVDRVVNLLVVGVLTVPVFFSMYDGRDKLFGMSEQSLEQVYSYADSLGENVLVSVEEYYRQCDM